MTRRSWSQRDLVYAVTNSTSFRQTIFKLGLVPAGGNYSQLKKYISEYSIETSHFKGKGWSKNYKLGPNPKIALVNILKPQSYFQSYKLKRRLINAGLKQEQCEECGWAEKSIDGRIPLELDHKNGDHYDNSLDNLRILCPNCHSLKSNHRGKNKKSTIK